MVWRRLCIDSRFRTADSLSNSDFWVELPYPVRVAAGSHLLIDGVCLSHSWPTVIGGLNDHLYVEERVTGGSDTLRTITLTPGQYNAVQLKDHVVALLNSGKSVSGAYSGSVDHGRLTLSNDTPVASGKCYIFSKAPADIVYLKATFPAYPGADCCELIGLWEIPVGAVDGTGWIYAGQSWTSQYMDLAHYKQVFIHMPGLGADTDTMNLRGNTDIVRRVLLGGSAQGEIVQDVLQTGLSSVRFGSDTTLKRLYFQVKGWDDKTLGMSAHQISFEIIIQPPTE